MSHPKRLPQIGAPPKSAAIRNRALCFYFRSRGVHHPWCNTIPHRAAPSVRMCSASDTPQRSAAGAHRRDGQAVQRDRRAFFDRFGTQPLEDCPEWPTRLHLSDKHPQAKLSPPNSIASLNGRTSRLIDYSPNATDCDRPILIRAVVGLTAIGSVPMPSAIDRLPQSFALSLSLEVLDIGVHASSHAPRCNTPTTPSPKKLATPRTARDQRHRMVPGSRPLLSLADTREKTRLLTPALWAHNPRTKNSTTPPPCTMPGAAKNQLIDRGVPPKMRDCYLLPNANPYSPGRIAVRCCTYSTNGPCDLLQGRRIYAAIHGTKGRKTCQAPPPPPARPPSPATLAPPCHLRANVTTPSAPRLALLRRKVCAGFSQHSAAD